MAAPTERPRICLLAAPETSPAILFGLQDVLATAGEVYPELVTGTPGTPLLDVKIVATDRTPFRAAGGVLVEPTAALSEIEHADVVLVGDMYHPVDTPPRGRYMAEIAWLRRMHSQGALIASVCSGALVVAEAGLLDGMECAAHWCYRDMFRKHYPDLRLREDLVLCLSAEEHGIVTAGAVSAWQEMALYLIARYCGRKHALHAAKIYLFPGHRDGQMPYAVTMPRLQEADAVVAEAQQWIAQNYAIESPVARLAARAGLSPRSLARRFKAATGFQPMEYVQTVRVEEAKQMLETTDMDVEEIGEAVGYADPASFRRVFKRKVSLSPAAYRRMVARLSQPGAV
jgi:transcriptional regulator GlxA family with amidase domain